MRKISTTIELATNYLQDYDMDGLRFSEASNESLSKYLFTVLKNDHKTLSEDEFLNAVKSVIDIYSSEVIDNDFNGEDYQRLIVFFESYFSYEKFCDFKEKELF